MSESDSDVKSKCLLCGLGTHPYLGHVTNQVPAHQLCIKFSKNVKNKKLVIGKSRLEVEAKKCETTICVFCNKPGAAAGCWKPYCRTKFHLGCSVGREVINRHDIFMSSCWTHSRRQGGVATAHAQCGVCGWGVAGAEEDFQSLVTPCCGSRHHRDCLQILGSLGVSSCPACSNSKSFKPEMIVNGIYFAETKYILPKPHVVNQEQSSNDSCGGKQIQSLDLDTSERKTSLERGELSDISDSLNRDSGVSFSSPLEASTPLPSKRKSPEALRSSNPAKRQKSFSINDGPAKTAIDCTILDFSSRKSTEGKFRDLYRSEPTADKLLISGIEKAELHPRTLIGPDDEKDERKAEEKSACSNVPEVELTDMNGSDERMLCIEYQEPQGDIKTSSYTSDCDDRYSTEGREYPLSTSSDTPDNDEKKMETKMEEVKRVPVVRKNSSQSSQESEDTKAASVPRKYLCLSEEKLLAFKRKQVLKKINKLPISERYILHGRNLLPWKQEEENFCEYTSEGMDKYDDCRIDEIIDLNAAEKNFFKLWNEHVRGYSTLGLSHMPTVVLRFIETSGVKILEQNLYRNFMAHLSSLEKMAVIGSDTLLRATTALQKLMLNIHVDPLNKSWRIMFRPGNKAGTSEFSSNLEKKNNLTRVRQKESRGTENTVTSSSDVSGIVVDTETGWMPILSDQTVGARNKAEKSPEMPSLVPQLAVSNTERSNDASPLMRRLRNPPRGRELTSERKVEEDTADWPRERKLEDKSPSPNAPTRRGKKSRKGNQKSEVEFAIKSSKKNKPKFSKKFSPIIRKLLFKDR